MKSILYSYTPQELQELLDNSNGYADILRKIGLNPNGSNPTTLKKVIKEYNLDTTLLNENRKNYSKTENVHKKISFKTEDILNNKYPNYKSSRLLNRLIKEGYKEEKCECCGITEWLGKAIILQLHHKDGNHNNNSLDNLEILCPNCHSQTDTYGGKSSKKSKKCKKEVKDLLDQNPKEHKKKPLKQLPVSRDELKDKIRNIPFIQIGKEYGVSDNAVRKWCDRYGLPRHSSVIQKYSDDEWKLI